MTRAVATQTISPALDYLVGPAQMTAIKPLVRPSVPASAAIALRSYCGSSTHWYRLHTRGTGLQTIKPDTGPRHSYKSDSRHRPAGPPGGASSGRSADRSRAAMTVAACTRFRATADPGPPDNLLRAIRADGV